MRKDCPKDKENRRWILGVRHANRYKINGIIGINSCAKHYSYKQRCCCRFSRLRWPTRRMDYRRANCRHPNRRRSREWLPADNLRDQRQCAYPAAGPAHQLPCAHALGHAQRLPLSCRQYAGIDSHRHLRQPDALVSVNPPRHRHEGCRYRLTLVGDPDSDRPVPDLFNRCRRGDLRRLCRSRDAISRFPVFIEIRRDPAHYPFFDYINYTLLDYKSEIQIRNATQWDQFHLPLIKKSPFTVEKWSQLINIQKWPTFLKHLSILQQEQM